VTGGRDSTVRVWDVRTKQQIFALSGHRDAIYSVQTQAADPQIVSSSADATVGTLVFDHFES
jgi:pleiotropic regulator 1